MAIIEKLQAEFWESSTEWIAKGLDTQAGKKLFLDALGQMVRNNRQEMAWYSDIEIIRRKQVDTPVKEA